MQLKRYEYTTELFSTERGIYAVFPFDGRAEFGKRSAVRVICTIEGYQFKCSLLPMGDGTHAIYVRKAIRNRIRKDIGDEVHLIIEPDLSPRVIEIPEDFQWLLDDDPELKQKFEKLSFSVREFTINYINEARLPETRARRIEQLIERIRRRFGTG
jgi:hypothetical protein